MSSLSTTAIIAIAAACGGVAVLSIVGLIYILLRRRKRGKLFDSPGQTQLSQHHAGDLDLREIETYTPSASHGVLPHWRRLKTRVYGQDIALMLEEDVIGLSKDGGKQSSVRDTSQGYRIVPNGGEVDQIDLEPVEGDELADIYLPTERPERAPLTPISERDTPESSRRALPRQGYHLPGNPKKWHYLARSGRNPSPGWFSDSSSASSNKLSKQRRVRAKGKAKSTTDLTQPGILRSLSFRSAKVERRANGELTPTPDAIYDACSRLSPSSSHQHTRLDDQQGSDSEAGQTQSAKSSIFDGHGSYTTAGSNLPSSRTTSKRDGKQGLHHDVFGAKPSQIREVQHAPRCSSSVDSPIIADTRRSPTSKRSSPSTDRKLNQSRKGSPSLMYICQNSAEQTEPRQTQPAQRNRHTQGSKYLTEQKPAHSFRFWQERAPRTKKTSASKKKKTRVLQESTSNSNRRSLSSSPNSSSMANTIKTKRSHGSGKSDRIRPAVPLWHRKRPDSVQQMLSENSRSKKAATKTVPEEGFLDDSIRRRSMLLPEVDLKDLASIFKKETTAKHDAIEPHQEDVIGPSALWSIIGDQSDASESIKPGVHPSTSGFSFEDSGDVLHLSSHDRAHSQDGAGHLFYSCEASSPQRSSNESYNVKPPSPLRPRSSMLLSNYLPVPSQMHPSPPQSPENSSRVTSELPQSLRIGGSPRKGEVVLRQASQRSVEKRRSGGSPSFHRSKDQPGSSREQLVATPSNAQKLSRFSNSAAPPNHPPPPPPPTSARSQAQMTSMMMELRRQNSDSSRYDSSYFRLPQSQRVSESSQRPSHSDFVLKHSSSRSSRSYVADSEAVEQSQGTKFMVGETTSSLSTTDQSRPTLWDRRARRERDPRAENNSKNHHQNFSRPQPFVITSPSYLPGFEADSLSAVKSKLEHLEQQELIGQAVELGMSSEPILLLQSGRDGSSAELHRTPTDDSEHDLSPVTRTIMAETRREQYGRQQRNGSFASAATSAERQPGLYSPPPLSPPHSQYYQRSSTRPSTSPSMAQYHLVRPTHYHQRNKSSLSSTGRSNSRGRNEPSQAESNASRSLSLVEGRKSRRESQRQRVEMLKERVASMEISKKGKTRSEPTSAYNQ